MNLVQVYNFKIISRTAINSIDNISNGTIIEITKDTPKDIKKLFKKARKVCEKAGDNLYSGRSLKDAIDAQKRRDEAKLQKLNRDYSLDEIDSDRRFRNYCEEFLDLDVALMSDEAKKEAYRAYKNC